SMSYPMTAHFQIPHGIACSITLPALLRFNAEVDDGRLARLAADLGHRTVFALGDTLSELLRTVGAVKELARFVVSMDQLVSLIPEMHTPGRADNNLRLATSEDLEAIIADTWRTLGVEEHATGSRTGSAASFHPGEIAKT